MTNNVPFVTGEAWRVQIRPACHRRAGRTQRKPDRELPAGRLYPSRIEDEARAWQWTMWALREVDRGVNIWSLHAIRLPPAERDAAQRGEALPVLKGPFKVLLKPYRSSLTFSAATLPLRTSM